MNQELKDRVDEAIHLESNCRNKNLFIIEILVDCRTEVLATDLKLLLAQTKLQHLLNELGALTQPNADGTYNIISPMQINKLRAEYFEDKP